MRVDTLGRIPDTRVFYLLHGGGDLDPGWSMTGRAHIIMGNLIAEEVLAK